MCVVHGAKIFIDSSVGIGTTFTVKFTKETE
ncbi:MAG: hypothetical protein PHF85_04975 [Bacilli bacterium]|nr:hypothetical protein [Bacilli bacterium]